MRSETLLGIVTIASIAPGSLQLLLSIVYQFRIAAVTRQNVDTTLDNTDVILEQLKPPETAEADAGTPGRAVGRRRGEGHAEGLAAFAGSLKDLEASTRGRLIAVVFYALAAVTASVGQIAS